MRHPCLTCGACCAHYRVAFHWSEAEPATGGCVPSELTEPLDAHRVAMRGTWGPPIRCVALRGEVGTGTACAVYAARPSPCRELTASWEAGRASGQCDRARAAHGLRALQPGDWAASTQAAAADCSP